MPPAADCLELILKNQKLKGSRKFVRDNKLILSGKICFFDSCSCGHSKKLSECREFKAV